MQLNDGTKDLVIEYLVGIANALDGKTEATSTQTGDRLRDALARIADFFEENTLDTKLPTVSSTDNGSLLTVVEGAWGKGPAITGLPAVTGDDNGKILKVVEGSWAVASAT